MDEDEIREYAYSKEPLDKAGGYGIQGRFAAYIQGMKEIMEMWWGCLWAVSAVP